MEPTCQKPVREVIMSGNEDLGNEAGVSSNASTTSEESASPSDEDDDFELS